MRGGDEQTGELFSYVNRKAASPAGAAVMAAMAAPAVASGLGARPSARSSIPLVTRRG